MSVIRYFIKAVPNQIVGAAHHKVVQREKFGFFIVVADEVYFTKLSRSLGSNCLAFNLTSSRITPHTGSID